jgi:hypothetical protein
MSISTTRIMEKHKEVYVMPALAGSAIQERNSELGEAGSVYCSVSMLSCV